MQFTITHWGCTPSGDSIYLFRLTNATGASIELTNLGPPGFRPICRTDTTSLKTFCWDMTMQKDSQRHLLYGSHCRPVCQPHSSGILFYRRTTYLLEKNDERTPITADYPAFTRRYGNGNGQIPASVSFSTLRTWKEDIREMYRRKWNINSRKPTN